MHDSQSECWEQLLPRTKQSSGIRCMSGFRVGSDGFLAQLCRVMAGQPDAEPLSRFKVLEAWGL